MGCGDGTEAEAEEDSTCQVEGDVGVKAGMMTGRLSWRRSIQTVAMCSASVRIRSIAP
jgi:hypothetical protein